jgi:septal ring factor EnvC (AmiA/AmiB activator)
LEGAFDCANLPPGDALGGLLKRIYPIPFKRPLKGKTMSDTQKITIICSRPGMRRAGMAHPAKATYASDHFTDAQLTVIKSDPNFQVLEGEPETADASDLEAAMAKIFTLEGEITIKDKEITSLEAQIGELRADEKESADTIRSLMASEKKLEAKVKKLEADLAKVDPAAKK